MFWITPMNACLWAPSLAALALPFDDLFLPLTETQQNEANLWTCVTQDPKPPALGNNALNICIVLGCRALNHIGAIRRDQLSVTLSTAAVRIVSPSPGASV